MPSDPGLDFSMATMDAQLEEGRCNGTTILRPGSMTSTASPTSSPIIIGTGRPDEYAIAGARVPSVTDVLDDWHPGGVDALCQWAHKTALGDPVKNIPASHWRIERDTAGDFGQSAHDWFTRLDRGDDADEIAREAEAQWGADGAFAFREYERFKAIYAPTYSHAEVSLYSQRYGYGGTFDRREVGGAVGDFKGSKKARVTMIAQLGAYGQLMKEAGMGWPGSGWLFHFPRTRVDGQGKPRKFIVYRFESGDLIAGRDAFLRLLDARRIAEELKELVRK